jgi:hypothetical protein
VPADRGDLPGETLLRLDALEPGQQPVYEPCDDVGTQGETRSMLAAALALDPRPLQERSMR